MSIQNSRCALAQLVGTASVLFMMATGCSSLPPGVPPRYEEPTLADSEVATLTTTGKGFGIYLVDGKLPCDAASYNMEGLKKAGLPSKVRLMPGSHELAFGCSMAGSLANISTNLSVSAGERYNVVRKVIGYTSSLTIEKETR